MPNPPLDDFSTLAAREDEKRRRRLRLQLRADFARLRDALDADAAAAIQGISDAEWQAAQDAEEEAL